MGSKGSRPLAYEGFTFAYKRGDEPVVDDLSLELQEGRVVLVTGPSGAGKTTICRAANGLVPHEFKGPMAGRITIGERFESRSYGVPALSKLVGVMSQDPETQLFNPTVYDEIAFGPCNYGMPVEEIRDRTERLLDLARLKEHRDRNPHNLSGGQQQGCALASILSFEPLVLVLDEPTSNIDPVGSQEVLGLVARLARDEKRTTLLVEHKIEELVDLVDEMIVLDRGRVLHRGSVYEVLENVEYIDSVGLSVPQVTLLAARLRSSGWPIKRLPLNVDQAVETLSPLVEARALADHAELPSRRLQHGSDEVMVDVRDLTHVYPDGTEALSGLSVRVRRGEFVAVLGQNGSGKTTLVKHLNGLLRPTAGTVSVAGLDPRSAGINKMAETVGFIFQNPDSQICKLKVADELAFGPQNVGLSQVDVKERVREAAEQLEIGHLLERNPFFLSKGEKQRVAVASVMAMRPEILVLDEPTTGQDFKRAREIMDLAVGLHERGQTVLVITHDMNLAAQYCDRVIVMSAGEIILDAPTRTAFLDRDVLRRSSLKPPQVTELGRALGYEHAWLTVDEAIEVLERAGEPHHGVRGLEGMRGPDLGV
jgi:energy-coupling factor transporter ATP-binding protein EcfA2